MTPYHSPLLRSVFPSNIRDKDLQLLGKPAVNFGQPEPPHSIFQAGDSLARENKEVAEGIHRTWRNAVLPEHDLSKGGGVRTHRIGIRSELSDGKALQVDQVKGLLKDRPKKKGLKIRGWWIKSCSIWDPISWFQSFALYACSNI